MPSNTGKSEEAAMADGRVYIRIELASREQLVALLKRLTNGWNGPAYRYQERVEAVELDRADVNWGEALEQTDSTLWPLGRLFCGDFEVRWRRVAAPSSLKWNSGIGVVTQQNPIHSTELEQPPDPYEVLVVAENNLQLPGEEWAFQKLEASDEYFLFLWGERGEKDLQWTETRIPRAQDYPVKWDADKTMAAICARDYRRDGIVCLTRLVRVEATRKPKE
jgi:hypothetical protein